MKDRRKRRALSEELRPRRLTLESLEARRVLNGAAPWHNDVYALDVDQSGLVSPHDALLVVNRLLLTGIGALEEPSAPPEFLYDTTGDNMLSPADLARIVNRLLTPPNIVLDTLMPFTIDLTPRLKISVSGPGAVPDGTPVHLDVDLNNDGFYTGGEVDYMVSSVYRNRSEFALAPALPANGPSGPYQIKLQARLIDGDGLPGTSAPQTMIVDTQTSDALANYVSAPDASYTWSQVHFGFGPNLLYSYYTLQMTSQTWREGDVDDPVWDHWLKVVIPSDARTIPDTALLFISGGSNTSSMPTSPSPEMVAISLANNAITVELKVVPNESVSFFAENPPRSRSEDEIISYTLDQYLSNIGEPGNETWPLLLPMVKSAVRAMDTIQAFTPTAFPSVVINDFIVTGYSKRGWTTWLTAAVDNRVRAIIPGVFDNPNQGPSMVHHYEVYGFFSEAVQDYNDMEIFHRMQTPEAQQLAKIMDPYSYFRNGKFDDLPILVLSSAGDEFFVSDSSQFYFEDLPGPVNRMRYFPNTGHGLDFGAVESTISFFDAVVNDNPIPEISWTVEPNGSIHAQTSDVPIEVLLWQATNPVARDFRWGDGFGPGGGPIGPSWSSTPLADQGGGVYIATVPTPVTGARAFLIEFTFASALEDFPHVFTTDIRVNSDLPLHPWPFTVGPPPLPNESTGDGAGVTSTTALTIWFTSDVPSSHMLVVAAMPGIGIVQPDPANIITGSTNDEPVVVATPSALADSPAYGDASDDLELTDTTGDGDEAVDSVFDELLDDVLL